mmetsp:Transcript_79281/g.201783  ORF Transcript_79281/g.201783 Transcript_79281/m.201783 type:complete len:204 (+) Transcript_79281:1022-1633(+)
MKATAHATANAANSMQAMMTTVVNTVSNTETNGLHVPPVVAVLPKRTEAFATCVENERKPPTEAKGTATYHPPHALGAKVTRAPKIGRTTVMTESSAWSTTGMASATTSRTVATPKQTHAAGCPTHSDSSDRGNPPTMWARDSTNRGNVARMPAVPLSASPVTARSTSPQAPSPKQSLLADPRLVHIASTDRGKGARGVGGGS